MENNISYDFIEIGTSDFHTLIESATDETIGLSIEPIKYYLDRLPNRTNVTKVQAAVSNTDDFIDIYYISNDNIVKNNLPFWVRGCNSVSKPHLYTKSKIGDELYDRIVTIDKVKANTAVRGSCGAGY